MTMKTINKPEEHNSLVERNKELSCLYEIARIVADSEKTLPEILQTIADVLPPAFHYPDRACARIRFDDLVVTTHGFRESGMTIREALVLDGQTRGVIEIFYRNGNAVSSAFLPEEKTLLATIAGQSTLLIGIRLSNDRKNELEEQLRHADRLAKIGQLTSGIAHELNEPLSGILGFAQLAERKINDPAAVKRSLERIVKACLNARQIIRNMMQFGSPSPPDMETVDLNHLIGESLALITPRFENAGVRFDCELSPDRAVMTGDPAQLAQVVVNLIINAIHAMPQGGVLTVATSAGDEVITLSVGDTGTGMDKNTMDQIFLPFFTTKDVDQGTGLGLSVVHGIVSAHGGTIDVSSCPGRGSVFTVRFPRPLKEGCVSHERQ
jgi:signal transduction histidine kinase